VSGFLFGVFGGIVAWFATMLIGQPLYQFRGLRFRVSQSLEKFSPKTGGRWKEPVWMDRARDEFSETSAEIMAFASTQRAIDWLLSDLLGYDLRGAGEALRNLSDIAHAPGSGKRTDLRKKVETDLKLSSTK
jgi:hypothetical protein